MGMASHRDVEGTSLVHKELPVVLRKTLPLKKVEEVGQIFCCLENSKKHE